MKIKIQGLKEDGGVTITLSNEFLENQNYIDLIVDGADYTVPIEELFLATDAFRELKRINE